MRTSFITLILTTLVVAACSPRPETDPETLVIAIQSQVKSFDPTLAMDDDTQRVTTAYAQALVELGFGLEPVGDLAAEFSSADARVYDFRLKPGVKFHDGRALDCRDVLASFDWARRPESLLLANLRDIRKTTCLAPDRFRVELEKPRASFLGRSVPVVRILPRTTLDGFKPVGTGPFRIREQRGRDIVLERFDDYVGPKPTFRRLVVRAIEDPTTLYLSLLGGDIDLAFNALAQSRVAEAMKEPSLQVFRGPSLAFQYLGFNMRLPKFRDERVRRALALGVPREEIIRHKLLNFAQPASSIFSPSLAAHDPALAPLPYDPAEAKRLLKEAGAANLAIDMKCSADRNVVSNLLVIKDAWEKLGLRVTLKPMEFGTFFADVKKGEFEMFMLRWTAVTDAQVMNEVFHSREFPPGRNRTYYKDAEVDAWLDEAATEPDAKKRENLYRKAERRIFGRDLPYIPLWHPDNIVIANRRLKGFRLHPSARWQPAFEATKETK